MCVSGRHMIPFIGMSGYNQSIPAISSCLRSAVPVQVSKQRLHPSCSQKHASMPSLNIVPGYQHYPIFFISLRINNRKPSSCRGSRGVFHLSHPLTPCRSKSRPQKAMTYSRSAYVLISFVVLCSRTTLHPFSTSRESVLPIWSLSRSM
jgi:hypothetical protein